MTSSEVLATIWKDLTMAKMSDVHSMISNAVEAVLKESINRRTLDNITVVMVAFSTEENERPKTASSIERNEYLASYREELEKKSLVKRN